jgi:hypothetical protein
MNARDSAKCAASYKLTKNVCEGAVKEGIEILEQLNLI